MLRHTFNQYRRLLPCYFVPFVSYSQLLRVINNSNHDAIAICDSDKTIYTYKELLQLSLQFSTFLNQSEYRNVSTVACYAMPSAQYIVTMFGSWLSRRAFCPLSIAHSSKELEYFIADSKSTIVIEGDFVKIPSSFPGILRFESVMQQSGELCDEKFVSKLNALVDNIDSDADALIVYTSGTTGRPKGVVLSHENIAFMTEGLRVSWKYDPSDRILHFLPLHHLHGLLNKLLVPLYAGAMVEFTPSASPDRLLRRLSYPECFPMPHRPITLFMAVPTIYAKILRLIKDVTSSGNKHISGDVHSAITPSELDSAVQSIRSV